ncbi:MAG: amidohydrolase [Micrococcales bacterium]|nr:amidohydrolase [Micrococcales bacterium]
MPADIVITGAHRWGLGPGDIGIGGALLVEPDVGPDTEVIDATGMTVVPGFQDAHVHTPFGGLNRLRVWLHDAETRDDYLRIIGDHARAHPGAGWITGGGWSMPQFPGGTPRKEDLDAVVPDRPVFLFNRDLHGAWLNSRALAAAGITAATPDPPDGRIERDPDTGEPTGTLHEGVAYWVNDHVVPPPSQTQWQEAVLTGQQHLHSLGITGWQDAWVTPATQAAYRSLAEEGRLTGRVVGALWWDRHRGLDQIEELVARRELAAPGFHPTTVKIMIDGVLENYTGALLEPYCDGCGGHTDSSGLAFVDPNLLQAAVTALDAAGFQVHMHAIGDRAVRMALDAVAAAHARNGMNDHRHHIAHLQLVHPMDLPRFAELGVTANCQMYWASADGQMDELTIPYLGAERARLQYPFASLARAGGRLAMGSDWSVSTANPLAQIEVGATRIDPTTPDEPAFLPGECITVAAGIDAFTAGSAYLNHDENAARLEVGRRADLALLGVDITKGRIATGHGLSQVPILLTVARGTIVHSDL